MAGDLVPESTQIVSDGHRVGAWALGLLITAHAVNALVRHFVIRDNTLERMAPVLRTGRNMAELALERGD